MPPYCSRFLAALGLALGALAGGPALAQDCPEPTPAELEAIASAYFDAFNEGDRAALDALLAADYQQQGAIMDQDRALHLDRLAAVRTGFPDGVFTIDWMMTDGDQVAVRHTFRGTQEGEFTGVAPSGNEVAVGAFHVHRIACGKIAETWNAGDALDLFHQIGALDLKVSTAPDDEPPALQAPPAGTECPTTTPEENVAAARRWYDEALNQRKIDVLDEIAWPEMVHHAGLFPDAVGIEAVKGSLTPLSAGFPDIQFSVDGAVASGDRVLMRWTGKGTHTGGTFLGVPTSGKAVEWSGMNAFRFACGKMIEGWSEANGLILLRQLDGIQ